MTYRTLETATARMLDFPQPSSIHSLHVRSRQCAHCVMKPLRRCGYTRANEVHSSSDFLSKPFEQCCCTKHALPSQRSSTVVALTQNKK
eukprot:1260280-Pleurochrysis_carterae.AAC.8